MITEEHKKESLSRAFVQAVAAKANLSVSINSRSHDYGIDGTFHKIAIINNKRVEQGIGLDFQLKATTDKENQWSGSLGKQSKINIARVT